MARAGFELTRDYPAPVARVWDAFADEQQKRAWWGAGDAIEPGEWVFDFRVGGRDVAEGTFHDGPVTRYEGTYTDIVEHHRIVVTYDMWIDGTHMSTSLLSMQFDAVADGTRFTHVEHGIFFDRFHADGPDRARGTRGILDAAKSGVRSVHIIDGRIEHSVLLEILTEQPFGTMIRSH